jgi:hypothetical protein
MAARTASATIGASEESAGAAENSARTTREFAASDPDASSEPHGPIPRDRRVMNAVTRRTKPLIA